MEVLRVSCLIFYSVAMCLNSSMALQPAALDGNIDAICSLAPLVHQDHRLAVPALHILYTHLDLKNIPSAQALESDVSPSLVDSVILAVKCLSTLADIIGGGVENYSGPMTLIAEDVQKDQHWSMIWSWTHFFITSFVERPASPSYGHLRTEVIAVIDRLFHRLFKAGLFFARITQPDRDLTITFTRLWLSDVKLHLKSISDILSNCLSRHPLANSSAALQQFTRGVGASTMEIAAICREKIAAVISRPTIVASDLKECLVMVIAFLRYDPTRCFRYSFLSQRLIPVILDSLLRLTWYGQPLEESSEHNLGGCLTAGVLYLHQCANTNIAATVDVVKHGLLNVILVSIPLTPSPGKPLPLHAQLYCVFLRDITRSLVHLSVLRHVARTLGALDPQVEAQAMRNACSSFCDAWRLLRSRVEYLIPVKESFHHDRTLNGSCVNDEVTA